MHALPRFAVWIPLLFAGPVAIAEPLLQVAHAGGQLSRAVSVGDYLYLPSGNAIETWTLADRAHPVRIERSPDSVSSPGSIDGATAIAGHLYTAGFARDGSRRVWIYSLENPAHPVRARSARTVNLKAPREPRA